MRSIDEDLRNRGAAFGAFHHLLPERGVAGHVDFRIGHVLAGEQLLRHAAIAAIGRSIDFNLSGHAVRSMDAGICRDLRRFCLNYIGFRAASTTRAKISTSTSLALARSSARAQASRVA